MAMVFKSKKILSEEIKKDLKHPGPGDYIPQTINKKIFPNKKHSSTNRDNFYHKNLNPGPGYYFKNEKNQNQKDSNNHNNKNRKSKSLVEKYEELFSDISNINNNTENKNIKEKLGFNTKAIRFTVSKDKIKQPGPGQYFTEINKFYHKNFLNKLNENYKPRKITRNKNKETSTLIPSIPSKDQKYGFNILEDGNITIKKSPNFSKTFTGEKGDSVGPGSYNTDINNELHKSRPKWTISKEMKSTMSLLSTNLSENSKLLDNSNLISSITANKFLVDDNMKVKELSPYNISSNTFLSSSNTNILNVFNKSDNKDIKDKNLLFKRIPLYFTSNGFFKKEKKELKKKKDSRLSFEINTTPGPGFYIDRFKNSSFNFKSVPENFQFFGSNGQRFNYKDEIKDERDIGDSEELKRLKHIKELKIPFSSSEERFKISYISAEKSLTPGPNLYIPKKLERIKSFSNYTNFGSCAKRFLQNSFNWKKFIPGPGTYNPEKIKSHINTRKMIETNYNKKDEIYLDKINYKLKTIEFENNKKASSTNLKNVSFYTTYPRLKKSNSCTNIIPDPGAYYVDKVYKSEQVNAPFHSSSDKTPVIFSSNINRVGPGQYLKDSYFDWNKKTFNSTFI